ncbi:MAG: hypothetical protein ABW163_08450 [Luteimonas sp.]
MNRIDGALPLMAVLRARVETPPPASTVSQQGERLADVAARMQIAEPVLQQLNPGLTPFDVLSAGTAVATPPQADASQPVRQDATPPAPAADATSPRQTLDAIEALPEAGIADLPRQLPDEDRQQILGARQDARDARILQMAEAALAGAEPPKLSDYAALPSGTARAEHTMAMAQYQTDMAALREVVIDVRVRQLEAEPAFQALPADTREAVVTAMRNGDYTITDVASVTAHPFHSGAADATRFDVTIDGVTTPVYLPVQTDPALSYHSLDQVAAGLVSMPPHARAQIERLDVNADRNPEDAHWEVEYNSPGFRSYMTAGAEGVVSIYPMPPEDAQAQDWLNGSLLHEVGHIVSLRDFSDDDWATWNAAVASDGDVVSDYARNSPLEDFAETYKLYLSVIGTSEEAAARTRFPERFEILDGMTGQG